MVDKILERKLYMLSRWEDRHLVRAHLFFRRIFQQRDAFIQSASKLLWGLFYNKLLWNKWGDWRGNRLPH